MSITILLIDDHDLIRGGLRGAFERDPDFEVVGESGGLESGIALTLALRPDVVVIDVNLPDGNGLDGVRRLRRECPGLGIVVLTMYGDDEHLFGSLDAEASAFVAKSSPTEHVLAAARHAAAAPGTFTAADLGAALRRRMHADRPRLTPREQEVLELLAGGATVASIARTLYVSESTVKSYVTKLYEKLGCSNRSQVMLAAVRLGLLKVDARAGGAPLSRGA